ncbi:hypothetical protein [Streptomyces sp. NPDC048442]|uniref:hypothetical protein n=1 Tax=Streptomyces sp. NPDC048442 TaxID=3154823 RepID=UPI0034457639
MGSSKGAAGVVGGLQEALAEASSSLWSRRARGGRALASFAEVPEAAEALVGLLLDVEDTAVARQTAEALARAGTAVAVGVLARAVAGADGSHADWVQTGVHDALVTAGRVAGLAVVCEQLVRGPEPVVRRGAAEILEWVQNRGG